MLLLGFAADDQCCWNTDAAGTKNPYQSAAGRDFKLMPGRTSCHHLNSQVKTCSFVFAAYIRRVPFRPIMVSLDKILRAPKLFCSESLAFETEHSPCKTVGVSVLYYGHVGWCYWAGAAEVGMGKRRRSSHETCRCFGPPWLQGFSKLACWAHVIHHVGRDAKQIQKNKKRSWRIPCVASAKLPSSPICLKQEQMHITSIRRLRCPQVNIERLCMVTSTKMPRSKIWKLLRKKTIEMCKTQVAFWQQLFGQ